MANWKFRHQAEGEIKEDPIQESFFTTSDVGDLTNALIRETIQNSMDARINKQLNIAKVRIYFNSHDLESEKYNPFFSGLLDHLKSINSGLEKVPDFTKPMNYLVIDDFSTTGLEGDIYEENDPKPNDTNKHNFYWFWRNNARSGKGEDDLGRWGVGKTVFSASSEINTFFGLTVRNDDRKKYLLGKSVLKWHTFSDNTSWYCPYGFFANYKGANSFFALPFDYSLESDKSIIKNFEDTFCIKHRELEANNDANGLSIVIPFLRKEINQNSITKAILKQYFYPIIEGKLIIEIQGKSGNNIQVSADTIEEILGKTEFEEIEEKKNLKNVFSLVKKSLKVIDSDYIKFNKPPLNKAPKWQDNILLDEKIIKRIENARYQFDNFEVIAFKIPIRIQEIDKDPQINWYRAFVQYDSSLNDTDSYFIRDGITISGVKTPKRKGLRILIVIDDNKMARMFGDSENPAHTEFQKEAKRFRNKYIDGPSSITFVTNTTSYIYNLLIHPSEGTDDQILKDIFYLNIESDVEADQNKSTVSDISGEEFDKSGDINITQKTTGYIIKKIESGVLITNNPKSEERINQLTIQLAYMVPKGNPLDKYNNWDFDLNEEPITIYKEGVSFNEIRGNRINFTVDENNFNIKITGFDQERDLFIKISKHD